MIQIKINNHLLDIEDDLSFMLSKSNPILTETGNYTLDIPLPITDNNISVLGAINRIDVSKKNIQKHKWSCVINIDNIQITGTAIVTNITNEKITMQLLGGKSELKLRFENDAGEALYIDDLKLPCAYENLFKSLYGESKTYNMENLIAMFIKLPQLFFDPNKYLYGSSDITDFVCFPIFSEADNAYVNKHAIHVFEESPNGHERFFWRTFQLAAIQEYPPTAQKISYPTETVLAPQPYVCYVVEQILKAVGYTVEFNYLRASWMKDIFIANVRGVLQLNLMLPHWTLKEFIEEVENTFGVRFILKPGNKIHIVDKGQKPNTNDIIINEVVDEFTIDIEEQGKSKSINECNVSYEFVDDLGYMILSDDILTRAKKKQFNSYDEMFYFYESLTEEAKQKSDTIYEVGVSMYASINPGQAGWKPWQVNMMNSKKRNNNNDEIKLRFIPVRLKEDNYIINKYTSSDGDKYIRTYYVEAETIVATTSDTRIQDNYWDFSINEAIKGNQKDRNKRDIIEVAYNPNTTVPVINPNDITEEYKVPLIDAMPFKQTKKGAFEKTSYETFWLQSKHKKSISARLDTGAKADTSVKMCITFISDKMLDSESNFIIRNKKYLCEKIEYTITKDGISPLKKGYFYEAL